MLLESQYLLLVLYIVQAYIKMLFRVICSIEYFMEDPYIYLDVVLVLSCRVYPKSTSKNKNCTRTLTLRSWFMSYVSLFVQKPGL